MHSAADDTGDDGDYSVGEKPAQKYNYITDINGEGQIYFRIAVVQNYGYGIKTECCWPSRDAKIIADAYKYSHDRNGKEERQGNYKRKHGKQSKKEDKCGTAEQSIYKIFIAHENKTDDKQA